MIRKRLSGILAAAGLLTGVGAVLSASCCVLPLALAGLGAGASVFSALEVIADYRTPLLAASAVLVVVAWCVYFGKRGAVSTAVALSVATAFVGTAAAWSYLERPLLKVVRASR
jgi:mercuric ion transport protein